MDNNKKILPLIILAMTFCLPAQAKDALTLARTGTAEEITTELKNNGKIAKDTYGFSSWTLLMYVLKYNRDEDVVSAVLAKSDVMAKDKNGTTPLMVAAEYSSNPKILSILIDKAAPKKRDAYIAAADSFGRTAFDYSVLNPNSAVYDELLKYAEDEKAQQRSEERQKNKELFDSIEKTAASLSKKLPMSAAAQEVSAQQNDVPAEPQTASAPLKVEQPASADGGDSVPRISIPQNQNQNQSQASAPAATSSDSTAHAMPLQEASIAQDTESYPLYAQQDDDKGSAALRPYERLFLYDFVIDEDEAQKDESPSPSFTIQNPDQADSNGVTLLMKAAMAGNDWEVEQLLKNGANIQQRDKDGWTALMYAVRYQSNTRIVSLLIDSGAYVRVRNNYNSTPLLIAAQYNKNPEVLSLLLKNRSNVEDEVFKAFILALTSKEGETYTQAAKVEVFLAMDMPINRIWNGMTPLMYACQNASSTEPIRLLINAGARVRIRDENGRMAFDYAKENSALPHDETYWSLNTLKN